MPTGSTITYIVSGTISPAATGTLANTASVAAPAGTTDPTTANNSATDSDTLAPQADLQITNTDGQTTVTPGSAIVLYDRGHQCRPEQRDRRHGGRHAAGHAHRSHVHGDRHRRCHRLHGQRHRQYQ